MLCPLHNPVNSLSSIACTAELLQGIAEGFGGGQLELSGG